MATAAQLRGEARKLAARVDSLMECVRGAQEVASLLEVKALRLRVQVDELERMSGELEQRGSIERLGANVKLS